MEIHYDLEPESHPHSFRVGEGEGNIQKVRMLDDPDGDMMNPIIWRPCKKRKTSYVDSKKNVQEATNLSLG